MCFISERQVVVLFSGIAQGIQRSITGVANILGPLWGGALTRRLYIMLGVMAALEVILAVSGKDLLEFFLCIVFIKVLFTDLKRKISQAISCQSVSSVGFVYGDLFSDILLLFLFFSTGIDVLIF